MLKKINIKNAFVHKNTTVEFEEGLIRLYGANEAGKSLVYEMIRWALFGSKALRSSSSDYKEAEATLTFIVGGETYTVKRTTGNAVLHKDKDLIARSTSAVNKKIIELLGYGLKTFDNVNAMLQGQAEKLTQMKAEERKKFMDELIGAAQIDQLIAEYKSDADVEAGELKALMAQVRTVDAPVQKYDVTLAEAQHTTNNIRMLEQEAMSRRTEFNSLVKRRDAMIVVPDPLPQYTEEQLNDILREQGEREARRKSIISSAVPSMGRLRSGISTGHLDVDIVELQTTVALLAQAREARRPKFSAEQIAEYRKKHTELVNWNRVTQLREKLGDYEACPRCGKDFTAEASHITDEINSILNEARPHKGLPSLEALQEDEEVRKTYDLVQSLKLDETYLGWARIVGDVVDFTQSEWEAYNRDLDQLEQATSLSAIESFNSLNSKKAAVQRAELDEEIRQAEERLMDLVDIQKRLNEALSVQEEVVRYQVAFEYYQKVQEQNAELTKLIETKKEEYETTQAVVKALQGFKYYVNTYFLPAVSKAGSAMLGTMTNGVRNKLQISDKFEITVDGQAVETLSGSTKAIVNIALRLALQFVLTKNTFSVFMGDEIDAAFDEDRAKLLAECLTGMCEHISQVIVISHRRIKADHDIKL